MRFVSLLTAAVISALALGDVSFAKAAPRYGALVYSSLCTEKQSGDVGGTRITLLRFADSDKVVYEYTEGAVMWPVFADRANIDTAKGIIRFDVRTDAQALSFRGTLSDAELAGSFTGKSDPIRLPRVRDLSKPIPDCP